MRKTTVYLPDELKAAIEQLAERERRSEADIIRRALQQAVHASTPPAPRVPLAEAGLGDPTIAERVDDVLEGFGEQ